MKIYVMTDLEGAAGIINFDDYCTPNGRYYETARELITKETNAAIEGLLEAGAKEILVVDGHGYGAINPLLLHPSAELLAGRPLGYPFGCNEKFDATVIIGQHAKSNTDGGHLCHTGSFEVEDLTINGISLGELGCNMLFAAYFGVPTVMVSGDRAACEEALALVPNIEVASVKEGIKRGSATGLTGGQNKLFNGAAIHLHPEKARELIKEKAKKGLERLREIKPFWLAPPYELVSRLRPEEKGKPGKIAKVKSNDLLELLCAPRRYEEIK
ncbi:peptidase M55 [Candidatus Bathyarchaeota archaeon]|nr:MAG: peptidase M55 [Candidatus Bathyarchaeota archaeon]